jgi:hypothetical protein
MKLEDLEAEINFNAQNEQNLALEIREVLNDLQGQVGVLNDEIEGKKGQVKSLVSKYKELEVERDMVREIDEGKKTGLGGRVTLIPEKYDKLRQIAVNSLYYKDELQKAEFDKKVAEMKLGEVERELIQYRELIPKLEQNSRDYATLKDNLGKTRLEMGEQFFSKFAEIREEGRVQVQARTEAINEIKKEIENIIRNAEKVVNTASQPKLANKNNKGLSR